jgi:hypothetical protein
MSTYGDRGNIIALKKRSEWREIDVEIRHLDVGFQTKNLASCDLLFMGGAQDRQQTIVSDDLNKEKVKLLSEMIERDTPGLYICGAYQLLGNYYKEADGTIIDGLGLFDIHTINPGGNTRRLIGNIAFTSQVLPSKSPILIGFENHGGRTYLGEKCKQFGDILTGFGNNGEDKTEGAIYKNSFGTYCHGPILPKNPAFTDYLIQKALERKYKKIIQLEPLDNTLEKLAHDAIAKRLHLGV